MQIEGLKVEIPILQQLNNKKVRFRKAQPGKLTHWGKRHACAGLVNQK